MVATANCFIGNLKLAQWNQDLAPKWQDLLAWCGESTKICSLIYSHKIPPIVLEWASRSLKVCREIEPEHSDLGKSCPHPSAAGEQCSHFGVSELQHPFQRFVSVDNTVFSLAGSSVDVRGEHQLVSLSALLPQRDCP